jgi:hypothetical protein
MFKVSRKVPVDHHKCLRYLGLRILSGAALLEYPASYLEYLGGRDIHNSLGRGNRRRIYKVSWRHFYR